MKLYAIIFGKNPDLSWGEFNAFARKHNIRVHPVLRKDGWVIIKSSEDLEREFRWLGGALKLIRIIGRDSGLDKAPYSKLFTVSIYGHRNGDWRLWRKLGSELKARFKQIGPSKFFKPASIFAMPSELILKGFPRVRDFSFIFDGEGFWFGETVAVTDPFELKKLDVGRPYQRPILSIPPRLARIMVNLTGLRRGKLLDPFCGVGTIVQEFMLQGFEAYGSDVDGRVVRGARKNLEWLRREFNVRSRYVLEVRDARNLRGRFDAVVTEPYLGKPLKRELSISEAKRASKKLDSFYREVFRSISNVATRSVVFTFPAFRLRNGGVYRRNREWLEDLGFSIEARYLDYEGRHRLIRDIHVLKVG
ncbi:MAG: site-specific DNA-methyltransferase [Thermococci archaeon]|nr:site-specific DNA-methyltransferase [Thermococci archaeon]